MWTVVCAHEWRAEAVRRVRGRRNGCVVCGVVCAAARVMTCGPLAVFGGAGDAGDGGGEGEDGGGKEGEI